MDVTLGSHNSNSNTNPADFQADSQQDTLSMFPPGVASQRYSGGIFIYR